MGLVGKELTDAARSPRLLLLDQGSAVVDTLPGLIKTHLPDVIVDCCVSAHHALELLNGSSYHAIICSPHLMLGEQSSVLTRSRRMQPQVPFLLTLDEQEREFGCDWLDWGTYDFILKPVNAEPVVESIREASSLYLLRTLLVDKLQALEALRQRRDRYWDKMAATKLGQEVGKLLDSSISRLEETAESFKRSADRIEATLGILRERCAQNEGRARTRALQRLGAG